ncbi:flagellar hook-basal body complex protein FliE [Clostridium sp. AF15-17LB]|nr:flagellar hook-basal body complex protein FliE [Clostridium sp. AF15-17LB]
MIESGFITPIQRMETIGELKKNENVQQDGGSLFSDIFNNAMNDVKETQANLEQQQYLLATGQIDDAHTVPIAASEAQMAVDMLVQLRNKALESYNELMRISL